MNEDQSCRPAKVGLAVTLIYLNIVMGVLNLIIQSQGLSAGLAWWVGGGAMLIFLWFFAYMIGKGRNWARIAFLVLFIIGIPFLVQPLLQAVAVNPLSGLIHIAQTILKIISLIFLFQKPSSDWFRQMKGSRQST